uniref:Uncharacterized protein n=1 Tax=Candidatus Kentrum sp. FM TaxID=2126340 RepID=A0A450TG95_9GAMM|nr:MAG: hypothetical protein BECKFM1743A_GA0114220_104041 [Candidatus Kentron sp. FM]
MAWTLFLIILRGYYLWLRFGCAILLSVDFLFFLYAFHAAISIRYWFAIDIAIDIRYRSSIQPRLFSIANRDIDSDPERTTTTGCGSAALCLSW